MSDDCPTIAEVSPSKPNVEFVIIANACQIAWRDNTLNPPCHSVVNGNSIRKEMMCNDKKNGAALADARFFQLLHLQSESVTAVIVNTVKGV
jgi:hypothetical protein